MTCISVHKPCELSYVRSVRNVLMVGSQIVDKCIFILTCSSKPRFLFVSLFPNSNELNDSVHLFVVTLDLVHEQLPF